MSKVFHLDYTPMITGILAPMPEEIDLIIENMKVKSVYKSGRRKFYQGTLQGQEVVVALSRIGKVASAVTAAVMIEHFRIHRLILTGVAGAIAPHLKLGDLVVATECVQHDLDARPIFPQFEAPLLGKGFFPCDGHLVEQAYRTGSQFLKNDFRLAVHAEDIKAFGLDEPRIYKGQLCCGDQFIGTSAQLGKIRTDLPQALCVEMEGGAVGQVCFECGIPYVVIRSISDAADESAPIDFNRYIERVARHYTLGIIERILADIHT